MCITRLYTVAYYICLPFKSLPFRTCNFDLPARACYHRWYVMPEFFYNGNTTTANRNEKLTIIEKIHKKKKWNVFFFWHIEKLASVSAYLRKILRLPVVSPRSTATARYYEGSKYNMLHSITHVLLYYIVGDRASYDNSTIKLSEYILQNRSCKTTNFYNRTSPSTYISHVLGDHFQTSLNDDFQI